MIGGLPPPYLYVILDSSYGGDLLIRLAQKTLAGGARIFQLRCKGLETEEVLSLGKKLMRIIKQVDNSIFIINDDPNICLELGADGVHLGREDMSPIKAREVLDSGAIVGATIHSLSEAYSAPYEKIDYVGVGPAFISPTKSDLSPLGTVKIKELYEEIRLHSSCPIIAIGGINDGNMNNLKNSGVQGLAIISAIANAADAKAIYSRMFSKLCSWGH